MKSILRRVIDKNGSEEMVFLPSARMILYSIEKAKNPGLSDSEVCALAGIDPQLPMRWRVKYHTYFTNWLEEAVDQDSGNDAAILERVGMVNALQGNFSFWKEMARSKGVIKDEEPKRGITVNTDFRVIMMASNGDLDAVRNQLLQATRGVGHEGGSGVALPDSKRERASPGSGAGQMQAGPLALDNALGPDGGRPERREPVPAVPKQATFAGSYSVLDEGEVPPDSEE